jgi:hypothetical protein
MILVRHYNFISYNCGVVTGHKDRNSVIFTAFFVENFTVSHIREGIYSTTVLYSRYNRVGTVKYVHIVRFRFGGGKD